MSATQAIGELSGRYPSERVATLLQSWLLPDEPILAALFGTVRLQNAWLVLTESAVVQVRDGMSTTVEGSIPVGDVTGYQINPGWSGTKLDLGTTAGSLRLDSINGQSGVSFVHLVQRCMESLGPTGCALAIDAQMQAFLLFVERAEEVLRDQPIANRFGDPSPLDLALQEVALNLAEAIIDVRREGYTIYLLLWILGQVGGVRLPRRETAEFVLTWGEQQDRDSSIFGLASTSPTAVRESLRPSVEACAAALDAIAYGTGTAARGRLLDRGNSYPNLYNNAATLVKSAKISPEEDRADDDDLLSKLERLEKLRHSGAIDEAEYATLKSALFKQNGLG